VIHYLTTSELQRIAHTTPGNEALADLLLQLRTHAVGVHTTLRVDLAQLLRNPDDDKGSLLQQ
jgi:hypothetical protein